MLCQPLLKLNLHISNEYSANKMILPLIEFAALFLDQRHWIFQIMVSTQPFQFFRPKTLESFSALLFLSQTSSNIFSQFCRPLLLLTTSFARALCRLFRYLPSWFPASVLVPQCLFSTQDRVIPIKLKLDHAIPLFRNLQVPSQLSPIHTQSHRNGLPDPVTPDTPPFHPLLLYSLLCPLNPGQFVPKFVCILLLKVFAHAVPFAWKANLPDTRMTLSLISFKPWIKCHVIREHLANHHSH